MVFGDVTKRIDYLSESVDHRSDSYPAITTTTIVWSSFAGGRHWKHPNKTSLPSRSGYSYRDRVIFVPAAITKVEVAPMSSTVGEVDLTLGLASFGGDQRGRDETKRREGRVAYSTSKMQRYLFMRCYGGSGSTESNFRDDPGDV